jgi:hypothetical protein
LGWGLLGAIFALAASWIVLWWYSLRYVNLFQKINFDWKFFTKNTILTIGLTILMYIISSRLFVLNDSMRLVNLWYVLLFGVVYYSIISLVNYKSVKALIVEVK